MPGADNSDDPAEHGAVQPIDGPAGSMPLPIIDSGITGTGAQMGLLLQGIPFLRNTQMPDNIPGLTILNRPEGRCPGCPDYS